MAAKKFGTDSMEYRFFRDLWKTLEAFGEVEDTDFYWNRLIYVGDKLIEKYENHPLAQVMTMAWVKEMERRWREKKDGSDNRN